MQENKKLKLKLNKILKLKYVALRIECSWSRHTPFVVSSVFFLMTIWKFTFPSHYSPATTYQIFSSFFFIPQSNEQEPNYLRVSA